MILEMVVWGFFSAFGFMGAQYLVDKVRNDNTELRCDQPAVAGDKAQVPDKVRASSKAECKGS